MLDLKDLNVVAAAKRGTIVELEHPSTGKPLLDENKESYFIEVLGEDSPEVRKVERKQADRKTERMSRGKLAAALSQDQLEEERIERLTVATLRWKLPPLNGETLEFTAKNARTVYGEDEWAWIPEQVEKAMKDRTRFFSTGSKP